MGPVLRASEIVLQWIYSTALTENAHSHVWIFTRKVWHQNLKEIQQENKILSVSLRVGISGPKYTRFIKNKVTKSRMMTMCVYLGMTQIDFNFWKDNSQQRVGTTSSILLVICRLPSSRALLIMQFSFCIRTPLLISSWMKICSIFTWPGWMFNTQLGNTEDSKLF